VKYEDVERGMRVRVIRAANTSARWHARFRETKGIATVYDVLPPSSGSRCILVAFTDERPWGIAPRRLALASNTIAEHMADVMRERGDTVAWLGSIDQLEECADRAGMWHSSRTHSTRIHDRVLDALDRSPLFMRGSIRGCDRRGRDRIVRSYTLVEKGS
jgi:hypothetical protein